MSFDFDKYRSGGTSAKKKEPEVLVSGSFNFEKYRSGTEENKRFEYGQYADAMKSSRLMEIDNLKAQREKERTEQELIKANDVNWKSWAVADASGDKLSLGLGPINQEKYNSQVDLMNRNGTIGPADPKSFALDDVVLAFQKNDAEAKKRLAESRFYEFPQEVQTDWRNMALERSSELSRLNSDSRIATNLRKFADATKPIADIGMTLYTPGAGLGVLQGATRGAEALVTKAAPKLAGSSLGRIGQVAASEAIVGAPTAVGQTLTQNPDASGRELLESAGLGAGGGMLLRGAGPLTGKAVGSLRSFADNAAQGAVQGNLRAASDAILQNTQDLPLSVRRVVSKDSVPELFPERMRRDFSSPLRESDAPVSQPARLSDSIRPEVAESIVTRSSDLTARPVQQGIRSNFSNQLENGNFSEGLQERIRNTDQRYDIQTNRASIDTANETVKDLSTAQGRFLNSESTGPEHIATGYRLMQELDAKGDYEGALAVSRKLAEDLTKGGQTTQAASIISRLSPEGQLLNLIRTAERNGKEVAVADSVKFKQLAAKVQEASGAGIRANQFNDILNRLERGEDIGVDDIKKLSDYLTGAEKVVKQNDKPIVDELPVEFKDTRKRDKIISFLDDAEQAALARIAARKNRLNALPIDEWADHAIVVSAQIAKGAIRAATHVEDLVKLFGEEIRPVASQVFQKAQEMIKGVSRNAASDNLEKASAALDRLTGRATAEQAIVKETADHVRKLIADAKAGVLNPNDVQKLRDYSDEIAEMLEDSAKPRRIPTQEERFLQSVKSLAKKIAQVEGEIIPKDQANREISSLLRQVTKIADEGKPITKRTPVDNKALSDIAYDVMEKTRPAPKPTTPQEKLIEKYIREQDKQGVKVSQKDIETLRELAKNVTRLSGDARVDADIAMQKILNSYEKSSTWDKLLAIRYMSMLLNTSTQAINAISGPIMATTGALADVLPAMVDNIMHKAFNTPRTVTMYGTNPLRFMARYFKNAKVGAKAGWHGVNPAGIQSTNEIRGLAFPGKYNPLGLAERTLGAVSKGADYATYRSVYESEMAKQAYLDAVNKGIKGRDNIKNHIIAYVNDPPEEAVLQADRIGKNTTFQRSDTIGGKAANWLNNAPPFVKPIVNSIFPFVRTPINIASTAVTMTPAGIIKGLYQLTSRSDASRREAIRTLSMGLTGSAGIGSVGYYLEQIGVITGANDSGNKDVDNIREQAGRGKYRFNTSALKRYLNAMFNGEGEDAAVKAAQYREGDKQFDYNKLQPIAFPLAIGASISENRDKSVANRLGQAGEDAFGSLFGMSTLRGVQTVFQPSYGGSMGEKNLGVPARLAESFFKSFSPGALAQEARRQDPFQRQTSFNNGLIENVSDYFKSRTPGLSQSLPPRKTTLGQNYENAPGIAGAYLNPYRSEVAPYNKAAVIISDLIDRTGDMSLAPKSPEKKVEGPNAKGEHVTIAIPPERYVKYQEAIGKEITQQILNLGSMSDAEKADRIKDIYSKVKEKHRNIVKRELGIRVK